MRNQRASQIEIGAFVVGGLVILVAAVLLIGTGRIFHSTYSFVAYFDGSVNGLRAGAPVKFKGVELGHVTRIRIPYWLEQTDPPIAVFFGLDSEKIDTMEGGSGPTEATLLKAIGDGLRAQLSTDSIVTGVMHVSLSIEPGSPVRLHDPIEGMLEIPTIPPPLEEIGAALRTLVERVSHLDIEGLFASLQRALDGVAALTGGPEARNALVSLDRTLADLDELIRGLNPLSKELLGAVQRADALRGELQAGVGSARETLESVDALASELATSVPPLLTNLAGAFEQLQAATAELEATLGSAQALIDPRAPIAVELRTSLREISDTLRSARAVFELIERDPAVILRGRGEDGGR